MFSFITRKKFAVLVLLVATGVAVLYVSAAAATPPSNVALYLTQNDDYSTVSWEANGAFQGSGGPWGRGLITFSGGKSNVFAGIIQTYETNLANTGSFRMNFQGLGNNVTGAFAGTWVISNGSGIYAGLHGTGTWYENDIPDPNNPGHLLFTFPCVGTAHFN